MEFINNVTLSSPKTMQELFSEIKKFPNATFFAGGTYLMSRENYFPKKKSQTYISLSNIPELHRIQHTDKYIELGSMTTIQQFIGASSSSLSGSLFNTLNNISSNILRNQITLGGSICIEDCRTPLCCILSAINTLVEIRFVTQKKRERFTVKPRWIPVSKLYDSDGRYLYSEKAVLTRLRVPSDSSLFFLYNNVGSLNSGPENSVTVAMQYSIVQNALFNSSFCITFLNHGIFALPDFISLLHSVRFPLNLSTTKKISVELEKMLKSECTGITLLQKERAIRLSVDLLRRVNEHFLEL